MASLYHSYSQNIINENSKGFELINKNKLSLLTGIKSSSPSTGFIDYGFIKDNNKLSRNLNKNLTSLSLNNNKTKFGNSSIFSKRENAFHQSIQNNKKVFKYQNFSLFEEKGRTTINRIKNQKKRRNYNDLNNKKYIALYLTQNILKTNKTMLPIINNEKSIIKYFKENNNMDKDKNRKKFENINYRRFFEDKKNKITIKVII